MFFKVSLLGIYLSLIWDTQPTVFIYFFKLASQTVCDTLFLTLFQWKNQLCWSVNFKTNQWNNLIANYQNPQEEEKILIFLSLVISSSDGLRLFNMRLRKEGRMWNTCSGTRKVHTHYINQLIILIHGRKIIVWIIITPWESDL